MKPGDPLPNATFRSRFERMREEHAKPGKTPFGPFEDEAHWELTEFLVESGLSGEYIDRLLKLKIVSACSTLRNGRSHGTGSWMAVLSLALPRSTGSSRGLRRFMARAGIQKRSTSWAIRRMNEGRTERRLCISTCATSSSASQSWSETPRFANIFIGHLSVFISSMKTVCVIAHTARRGRQIGGTRWRCVGNS